MSACVRLIPATRAVAPLCWQAPLLEGVGAARAAPSSAGVAVDRNRRSVGRSAAVLSGRYRQGTLRGRQRAATAQGSSRSQRLLDYWLIAYSVSRRCRATSDSPGCSARHVACCMHVVIMDVVELHGISRAASSVGSSSPSCSSSAVESISSISSVCVGLSLSTDRSDPSLLTPRSKAARSARASCRGAIPAKPIPSWKLQCGCVQAAVSTRRAVSHQRCTLALVRRSAHATAPPC